MTVNEHRGRAGGPAQAHRKSRSTAHRAKSNATGWQRKLKEKYVKLRRNQGENYKHQFIPQASRKRRLTESLINQAKSKANQKIVTHSKGGRNYAQPPAPQPEAEEVQDHPMKGKGVQVTSMQADPRIFGQRGHVEKVSRFPDGQAQYYVLAGKVDKTFNFHVPEALCTPLDQLPKDATEPAPLSLDNRRLTTRAILEQLRSTYWGNDMPQSIELPVANELAEIKCLGVLLHEIEARIPVEGCTLFCQISASSSSTQRKVLTSLPSQRSRRRSPRSSSRCAFGRPAITASYELGSSLRAAQGIQS